VILVIILLSGIVWLVRYLSEVLIPVAVAILLTALMLPVANALKKGRWGLPRAAATAITVLGAVAAIVGVLIVIGGQIAGQGPELSANVVNGFNKLSDWLSNGPLTNWLRNGPLHLNAAWLDSSTWVSRITEFLKASGSTIATYAAEFGAQLGHFLAGLAIALFSLFYFIYDGRGIFTFVLRFFPRASRDRVDQAGGRCRRTCGQQFWLRWPTALGCSLWRSSLVFQWLRHLRRWCFSAPSSRSSGRWSRVSLPYSSPWSRLAGSRR
jgi:predicted PurR-regulated permease PerM